MGSITIALITFGCIFVGTLIGSALRNRLPQHHLSEDSKDVIKVGAGFIATLTALVLGLLVSSAKNSFDTISSSFTQNGAKVIALDRILVRYGPETKEIRQSLRSTLAGLVTRWWPEDKDAVAGVPLLESQQGVELVCDGILKLSPKTDSQKALQTQAVQTSIELAQGRCQMIEEIQVTLPTPFLVVLISWLTLLFACFSLLAPRNATNVAVLLLCVLSVSGAIFLVVEMCHPESGIIKVSSAPVLKAFALLGQ